MQWTPGKTKEEREAFWTRIIEQARAYPGGVSAYCRDKNVNKDNFYQWFKKLKPKHPEWTPLPRPNSRENQKASANRKKAEPETQVVHGGRRRFTREYKLAILKLTDNASVAEISSVLRKEGLYSAQLEKWRAERTAGSLQPKKRGPKTNPLSAENKRLKQENERLVKKLRQQEMLIDLQKKVAEILNVTLPKIDESK